MDEGWNDSLHEGAAYPFGRRAGVNCALCSTRHGQSNKEKTKCLASSVQKLWKGSQNFKVGHVTLATPPLGSFIIHYVVLAAVDLTKTRKMAIANKTCVSGKSRGLKICSRSVLTVRQINIWQAVNFVSTRKIGNYYHKRRLFTNTTA